MKQTPTKAISMLILALATHVALFGQSKDAIITNIRKQFQSVNQDSSLKIIKLENEEFMGDEIGDGGGELKGYFKVDQVLKATTWFGLSNGVSEIEYYYQNNELIFVYEVFKRFPEDKKTGELDHSKLEKALEGRYYFDKKKLIHKIAVGQGSQADGETDPGKFWISRSDDWLKILKKEYKTRKH